MSHVFYLLCCCNLLISFPPSFSYWNNSTLTEDILRYISNTAYISMPSNLVDDQQKNQGFFFWYTFTVKHIVCFNLTMPSLNRIHSFKLIHHKRQKKHYSFFICHSFIVNIRTLINPEIKKESIVFAWFAKWVTPSANSWIIPTRYRLFLLYIKLQLCTIYTNNNENFKI